MKLVIGNFKMNLESTEIDNYIDFFKGEEYGNVILEGNKLLIDTGNSTITHVNSNGVRTNASIYYNHEYPKIKYGINELKVLSGVDDSSQVTVEWYDLKL